MSVLDKELSQRIFLDLAIGNAVFRFLAQRSFDVLSVEYGVSRPTLWRALGPNRPKSLTPDEVREIRKIRAEWHAVRPLKKRFSLLGIAKKHGVDIRTVISRQRRMHEPSFCFRAEARDCRA